MLDHRDSPPAPPVPAACPEASGRAAALAGLRAVLARPPAAPGALPLVALPPMALARGRVHEATGPARRVLAALAAGAAQAEGPVIWLRPGWRREGLCPQGLAPLADPGALVVAACPRPEDIPWAAEEALRSGAAALVVAELAAPPDLRQVRRLHLAAAEGLARACAAGRGPSGAAAGVGQAGATGGGMAPLGLLLAAEAVEGALAGVESRWRLAPLPPDPARPPRLWRGEALPVWRLDRLRARDAPPAAWRIGWRPGTAAEVAPLAGAAPGTSAPGSPEGGAA